MRRHGGRRRRAGRRRGRGGFTSRRIVTALTPGRLRSFSVASRWISSAARRRLGRDLEAQRDVAAADREVLDEAERDDVAREARGTARSAGPREPSPRSAPPSRSSSLPRGDSMPALASSRSAAIALPQLLGQRSAVRGSGGPRPRSARPPRAQTREGVIVKPPRRWMPERSREAQRQRAGSPDFSASSAAPRLEREQLARRASASPRGRRPGSGPSPAASSAASTIGGAARARLAGRPG